MAWASCAVASLCEPHLDANLVCTGVWLLPALQGWPDGPGGAAAAGGQWGRALRVPQHCRRARETPVSSLTALPTLPHAQRKLRHISKWRCARLNPSSSTGRVAHPVSLRANCTESPLYLSLPCRPLHPACIPPSCTPSCTAAASDNCRKSCIVQPPPPLHHVL